MLGLKKEEKCFPYIQIPLKEMIKNTAISTIICFLVVPPNSTKISDKNYGKS